MAAAEQQSNIDTLPGEGKPLVITDLPDMINVADELHEQRLNAIGQSVWQEYEIDKSSRADVEEEWKEADKVFQQKRETKSWPFENASNVRYPLMLTSSIQFNARAMGAVINNGRVAKGRVVGSDPQGAKKASGERIASLINYQLIERDNRWAEEMDRLTMQLPLKGTAFKRVYWKDRYGARGDLVSANDLVVNVGAKSLDTVPRYSYRFDLYPHEIEERKRDGRFLKVELIRGASTENEDKPEPDIEDKSAPHEFIEQFRLIDLDEDGYPEPYHVVLHVPSRKVVRIFTAYDPQDIEVSESGSEVMRIGRRPLFIKYEFLPDPEGGFYGIGFGRLLLDLSKTINSIMNQIIDAGTLQNAGGGFIGRQFRMKSGMFRQRPGEFQQVTATGDDIRKSIVHMEHKGPSDVLFQMLGLLIEQSKEIASVQDVLTGDAPANQPATTTLALIEQGLKVFTGIISRLLRSQSEEIGAIHNLNSRFMPFEEYQNILDDPEAVEEDFNVAAADIVPVSDATVTTEMQRAARAEFLMQWLQDQMVEPRQIRERIFENVGIPHEGLIVDPPEPAPEQVEAVDAENELTRAKAAEAEAKAFKALSDVEREAAEMEDAQDQQERENELREVDQMTALAKLSNEEQKALKENANNPRAV